MAEVIHNVIRNERALVERLRRHQPILETYIQDYRPDSELGAAPQRDQYFLARLDTSAGLKTVSLLPEKGAFRSALKNPFSARMKFMMEGFAAMMLVDGTALDESRYEFRLVRREFLGETRCVVFDVVPRGREKDRFTGRIWVEDRGFNIVRFNGVHGGPPSFFGGKYYFHCDSWRQQMGPGLWMPAYVYSEESDVPYGPLKLSRLRFRAQTRIWGYDRPGAGRGDAFTAIQVREAAVRDRSEVEQQLSPVASQREWERQAEDNILDRLERAGFIAPAGEVDRILETVANNLVVTNGLTLDPPVRCRILMTTPLESFTIGNTIVVSRGLVDVLPSEAALAMMLSHELGHIAEGHAPVDTRYSFHDRLLIDDVELLDSFRFERKEAEERAADAKGVELLRRSPYAEKVAEAGLFLRAVASRAKDLPSLIQPHLGDRIATHTQIVRLTELMNAAPQLETRRTDQIAALPLGGRILIDPWTGRIEMLKLQSATLVAPREKMPFEVVPLRPYPRYQSGETAQAGDASQAESAAAAANPQ